MLELSGQIADKLYKKGFTPAEVPELLDDLSYLIQKDKAYTSNYINQELEILGWGIQIIDESLFKEILQFLVRTDDTFKKN